MVVLARYQIDVQLKVSHALSPSLPPLTISLSFFHTRTQIHPEEKMCAWTLCIHVWLCAFEYFYRYKDMQAYVFVFCLVIRHHLAERLYPWISNRSTRDLISANVFLIIPSWQEIEVKHNKMYCILVDEIVRKALFVVQAQRHELSQQSF